ncbi:Uncharacterized protein Fot_39672 [Forsythia ovata]|uniref:Uncharacterized protein n=1 Tax=Forsythia ovata TaxID=205694 RepID=A0ABD1S5G0_9LAMI
MAQPPSSRSIMPSGSTASRGSNGGCRTMKPNPKSVPLAFAAKFAKNAALYALDEGCKMVPGGAAVSNIVSKIIKDVENETLNDNPKPLEERVSAQVKQLSDAQLKEQGETQTNSLYRFNVVLIANQKPEDVAIDRKNLSLSSRL